MEKQRGSVKLKAVAHDQLKMLALLVGKPQNDILSELIDREMRTPEMQELAQRFAKAMNSYKGDSKPAKKRGKSNGK